MTTLDNPSEMAQGPAVSGRPIGIRFGLIGGLLLVGLALVLDLTGMTDAATGKGGTLSFIFQLLIMGGAIGYAIYQYRQAAGKITFGQAFGTGFWAALIMVLISGVYSLLFFLVIDPEVIETIKNQAFAQMEEQGMSDSDIEQSMGMMGFMFNPWILSVTATISNLIFAILVNLVLSAVLKNN
jgi:hypothetical protein